MIITCYILVGLLVLFFILADQTNAWGVVTDCKLANIVAGITVIFAWPLIISVEVLSLVYELRSLR